MNVNQQREAVKTAYPSASWRNRVRDMPESQVQALYIKFRTEGKLK